MPGTRKLGRATDSRNAMLRATSRICVSDSTEQGPAMIAKLPPPILTPEISITESSG